MDKPYISVEKEEPPKGIWIYGNFSDGGKGYPIYIEEDGKIYYKTLCGRRLYDTGVLLEWSYES